MCHFCAEHGNRDQKWYEKFENYLFNKVFVSEEDKQKAREGMMHTFAATEWRYADKEYVRNPEYLQSRAKDRFAAQIVTYEESIKILELAEEATKREDSLVVVGHCPCKQVYDGSRSYVCIGFGFPVSMSMEIAYGRLPKEGLTEFGGAEWRELRQQLRKDAKVPLKLDEARELLLDWEKKGLWHLVVGRGRLPLIEAICNCEKPYCTYWRYRDVYNAKEYCLKGHYVAVVDPLKCTACGACSSQCQFGAIHTSVINEKTFIDPTKCFGCGICRVMCPNDAIMMKPREDVPIAANLW